MVFKGEFIMLRDDMIQRLLALDEEVSLLYPNVERINMVIVGGGALVLMEYLSRSTHDIDVLSVSHRIQDLMLKYDMNTQVQTYINNFPYNYEDRIKPVPIHGRIIDFYTASLEDIVIAKLYSYRDSDLADISAPEVVKRIDWELLRHLATAEDEAKASALNEFRYREFLDKYYDYEKRCRPCDN